MKTVAEGTRDRPWHIIATYVDRLVGSDLTALSAQFNPIQSIFISGNSPKNTENT